MAFLMQSKAVRYLLGISGATILALGLGLLLLATNPGRNETIDVGARLAVTRQLWTAGKVAVRHRPHGTEDLWIEIAPDRYVAPYGIGQSLVFVPFDMVGSVLEHFAPEAWRGQLSWLPIGFGLLPLLGLGYWYALRRLLQEWGFIHPWPTLGALAMMLGTIMFFYAGQAQEENLVGLCLTLTMLFALRLRRRPTWNNALAAGFFAGACLTIRPVSVFALLIVPVLIFTLEGSWTTRSRSVAVTGVATAALHPSFSGTTWRDSGMHSRLGMIGWVICLSSRSMDVRRKCWCLCCSDPELVAVEGLPHVQLATRIGAEDREAGVGPVSPTSKL